jgi:hypothetical protein
MVFWRSRTCLALLSLLLAQAGLHGQQYPLRQIPNAQGPFPGFDVRYAMGIAPSSPDLAKLVERPTAIYVAGRTIVDPKTGFKVLEGQGDGHGVFDLPLEALADVLDPSKDRQGFFPGVLDERVVLRDGSRTLIYQMVGISFLGIKLAYPTISEVYRDDYPDGSVGFRARLVESLDGRLYQSYSSWFLVPVRVAGKTMTYARTYMRSGLYKPFAGADSLLKAFMPGQLDQIFNDNIHEARRRLQAQRGAAK